MARASRNGAIGAEQRTIAESGKVRLFSDRSFGRPQAMIGYRQRLPLNPLEVGLRQDVVAPDETCFGR
ncbi:MAG: hypothetical protein KAT86_00785, partial [Candidatus Latescibacteria bacterium]|nr:hypothetical protein [Candidatus Latescibacterota bacterium]